MLDRINGKKRIGIIIIILITIVILLYAMSSSYEVRTNNVIILSFYKDIVKDFSNYDNVSVYILRSDNMNYYYRADIVIVFTHTANLQNKTLLIALAEPPDIFTVYGINISGQIYKAIPIESLASRIHADRIILVGCNIREELIYNVFKNKAREVYYYKCPADPKLVLDDLKRIIAGKQPQDKCFERIIYDLSR